MNYYKFHIGDYRRDTAHLSLLEHGVYRQLLDLYYLQGGPIPKETQWVIRRLSAKTQEEASAIQMVLNDFFELREDGYHHARCDHELAVYTQKSDRNAANGKHGGRPAKSGGTRAKTQTVSENNPDESESEAKKTLTINHKPITNNKKEIQKKNDITDLLDLGVPEQTALDFLKIRKAKKAPLTPTAIDWIKREAAKAGKTFAQAVTICVERNWQGFNAEWLRESGQNVVPLAANQQPARFPL